MQKNQIKRKKERSRDFPLARWPTVLVPRTSRARALLEPRALRRHVLSCTRPQLALHSCERFSSTSSSYGLLGNSPRTSSLRHAPLSSGCVASALLQSGEDTLPFPRLSSLRNQAEEEDALLPLRDSHGRFGGTSRRAPENQADTEPQQQRSAPALWRETSPRLHPSLGECHHTVLV